MRNKQLQCTYCQTSQEVKLLRHWKLSQLIQYNVINSSEIMQKSFKNHAENEAERLVPGLFLFFWKSFNQGSSIWELIIGVCVANAFGFVVRKIFLPDISGFTDLEFSVQPLVFAGRSRLFQTQLLPFPRKFIDSWLRLHTPNTSRRSLDQGRY